MFKRILIANRGEIALRIIHAANLLGIETVLVCSSEDRDSLPAKLADHTVCIGPPPSIKSYLNQESILQTALSFHCEAIHPGYGFLSENAQFAARCEDNGITFIGPRPDVIALMGDKEAARRKMKENGVPVVPGSDGLVRSETEAKKIAAEVGYPILLKASAGGGGKGMRVVNSEKEISNAFLAVSAEALLSFGNGDLYLEKKIIKPRHIEVQVLGDHYGNLIHLGDRDCSIQRRNQKVIEEAPAYALNDETKKAIRDTALKAAKVSGYTNAGTVEFVLDQEDNFYFIEMNTRIQVEHPVTEMITGVDIVKQQLRIASNERLDIGQDDIHFSGAAIECRINAEDPANRFVSSPGSIDRFHTPGGFGVRIESAMTAGSLASSWYDSMIGKLIVQAETREEAIVKMRIALEETQITGVKTNLELLKLLFDDPNYIQGNVNTSFLMDFIDNGSLIP